LSISTITNGENVKTITSNMFSFGNTVILKISLRAGINNIAKTNIADMAIARINFILLNIFLIN